MAMHEQILRKEQDPFHKPEAQKETEAEQAAAAGHRRVDAEEQRATETERTCWHCAAEVASKPLASSGASTISEWNCRMVEVNGTTWITEGDESRIR